jgi:1-deoxy-D-xylulose-5-phosphate reductoisomerase
MVLEELLAHPRRFRVVALAAGARAHRLAEQARRCRDEAGHLPALAVADPKAADAARGALVDLADLAPVPPRVGPSAIEALLQRCPAGWVVCAVSGLAAWGPVRAAARQGRRMAVASKEVLALAGGDLARLAAARGGELLALDSELTAAQRLRREHGAGDIKRLVLPATGGPFVDCDAERLAAVTPAEACRHPVWPMGPKISVDSATGVNKSLEVVVAHELFGLPPSRLEVALHPAARIHAVMAGPRGHLALEAPPDMRTAVRQVLGLPTPEVRVGAPPADAGLEPLDEARFPGAALGHAALARGPAAVATLVGTDEALVAAFLGQHLPFHRIVPQLGQALAKAPHDPQQPLEMLRLAQRACQATAQRLLPPSHPLRSMLK